jgi:hypothetical protein
MKARLPFTRSAALGLIVAVLIPLSACQGARGWSVQTAWVDNGSDLGVSPQPEEKVRLEGLRFQADGASLRRNSKPILTRLRRF